MSFWSFTFSLLVHGGGLALCFLPAYFSPGEKNVVVLRETPPCTIPLEVTAVSDISCAPISRPKIEAAQSQEERKKPPVETLKRPEPIPEPMPAVPADALPEVPPEPVRTTPPSLSEEPTPEVISEPEPIPEPVAKAPVEPLPEPAPLPPIKPVVKTKPKIKKEDKSPEIKKNRKKEEKKSKTSKKIPPPKKESPKKISPKPSIDPVFALLEEHDREMKKKKSKKPSPADSISVLKNVDRDQKSGPTAETPITDPNSDSDYGAPAIGPHMAMSVIDRVRRLLESAWRVPLRANEGGSLIVMVCMDMNPDGTVRTAQVDHQRGTPSHPAYGVACDSALRAVEEFRFKPLPFPRENYDQWKNFEFRFLRK